MIYSNRAIYLIILCICEFGLCFLDIDEFRELKYGIEIRRRPVIFSHLPQDNVVHLSSKYGQMYQCNLPVREIEDPNSEDDLADQANITVKAILDDAFTNQCLIYNLGWWTYKVCYKKEVTQYHEDNGILQGAVINLGSYESEKDWNDTDYKRKQNIEEYHTHHYINGSNCELVGKERQTTVKFVCSDESSNLITSVDEPETCTYTITIGCKDLCVHPLFKPKKKESVKEIICSPAISKDQYEQYLNQEQENLLKRKKAEEEEAAKVKSSPKKNKVEVLMSSLDSFASGFTSFVANNLVPSGDETEDSNQEQPKDDLSNFWKDLGYNPEGPEDSSTLASKREMHKTGPDGASDAAKEEPKVESETNETPSDNTMSKGDSMLSTEGQFIGRDPKNEEQSVSKINENVKRLISLQSTINEINKQAAALIKKDQDKRRIFLKSFFRSKRKVEKQIGEFKKLMIDLKLKKSEENDKNNKARLEKLIRRVNGNIKNYKAKLSLLEAKVKKTLQKSKAFEKSYRDLLQSFPIKHASKKTDFPGTKAKSLNEVIRELRTEKNSKDASRIVKSGNQLASEEDSGKNTQDPDQDQTKKLDPLLETLMSMLKLSKKMKDSDGDKAAKEKDDSENSMKTSTEKTSENEEESLTPAKSSKEPTTESENNFDGNVKVRIRRLSSEDTKLIEENEKQEELSGTGNANNRLKTAGKKIEDIIKKKLKKAGVNIGANIKIKIITNEGPLSSMSSNSKTEFLTDETATQFKDLLTNMLGGGAEKVKEEKRQSELEDSYKFVWNQDESTNKERTDYQDSDRDPFFDADL